MTRRLKQFSTPRARNLLTLLFLLLLPPAFFWRETLGRVTLGDKDAVFWFFPAYKFVAEQIKSGNLPLWNPYQYSGAPMFAEWQAGALDPINWIYLIETTSRALTLSLEIGFAIALLATFSYARSIGFNRRAAVVSAVIYGLSGFLVARTLYPGFLHIVALAPFVLYFVEKLYQRGRWRHVAGGALVVAWQVFAAHPQPLIYSSLLACAYALFCALFRKNESQISNPQSQISNPKSQISNLKSQISNLKSQISNLKSQISNLKSQIVFLAKFALMFVAGACLSAIQLLPAAEFASQSVRREWPFELFTLHSLRPLSLLTALFPFFHGEGQGIYRMPYWGVYWHHNEAQIYLGVIALSLAIAGAISAWRARFGVGIFWSCVAVAGVILAFGKYSGPIARALYHVPVLGNFRSPNRHWMEVALAVAMLAGYAVDRLLSEESWLPARVARIASLSLAALCVAVGGFVLWRKELAEAFIRSLPDLGSLPPGFLQTAGAEFYLPMIAAVCAMVVIALFARSRNRSRWFAILLALLIIDYHLYAAFAPITNPDKLETLVGTAMPKALAAKQSERDPIRYHVTLNPASGEFNPFWFYGAEMVTGYDPVLNERYKTFSGIDEAGRSFIPTLLDSQDHTLDLLNVRYVFAPPSYFDPPAIKNNRAEPAELRMGEIAVFKAGASGGDSLAIVSSLANSSEITDGEEVAEITINCDSVSQWWTTLRAGRDTSEWAYDRADAHGLVKHSRAKIAESWNGDASSSFQAHSYIARVELPKNLRSCQSPRAVRVRAKARGGASIIVKKIAFETATGRSITLAQAASSGLNDQSRWSEIQERSEAKPYRDFRIFENLRSMPRAWLVDRIKVAYEGDQLKLIRGESSDGFDPRTTALVDHATAASLHPSLTDPTDEPSPTPSSPTKNETAPPRSDEFIRHVTWSGAEFIRHVTNKFVTTWSGADILEHAPTRMLVGAEARKPSILVLSEIVYPGWRVRVDGIESELLRVNYNLRGVALAPGKHQIEFVYSPASLKVGAVVSIATALCLLLVVLRERKKTKRIKASDVV